MNSFNKKYFKDHKKIYLKSVFPEFPKDNLTTS